MPFTLQFPDRRQHLPTKHREDGCQSGLGRAHRAFIEPTPSRISSRASWTRQHRSSSASQVTPPRLQVIEVDIVYIWFFSPHFFGVVWHSILIPFKRDSRLLAPL